MDRFESTAEALRRHAGELRRIADSLGGAPALMEDVERIRIGVAELAAREARRWPKLPYTVHRTEAHVYEIRGGDIIVARCSIPQDAERVAGLMNRGVECAGRCADSERPSGSREHALESDPYRHEATTFADVVDDIPPARIVDSIEATRTGTAPG